MTGGDLRSQAGKALQRADDGTPIAIMEISSDITERARVDGQLRESEERHRTVLTALTEGVVLQTPEAGIITANASAERILGLSRDQLFGMTPYDPFWRIIQAENASPGPGDYPVVVSLAASTSQSDVIMSIDKGTEELTWVSTKSIPLIRPGEEQPYASVTSFTDITERRQFETALRESERRFRAIFNNTFQFTGLLTPDGILLEVNQTALTFGGLTLADVQGKLFWTTRWWTFTPGTHMRLRRDIEDAAGGAFVRYTVAVRGAGETTATIDFSLKPVRDEQGAVVLLIYEGRDITERIKAEAALRESEARYRTVLAALDEGVVLQSADGAIIAANASAERILGLREEQLIGHMGMDRQWEAIREDGTPLPEEAHPAMVALRTGETQMNVVIGTHIRDGAVVWLSVNARPLFRPGETHAYGVVASLKDITEHRQAEEQLRHTALHDTLTGIANRALFMDRFNQAFERTRRRPDRTFAVLFLDFDRFKSINDNFGHHAGDELLIEAARRLQNELRAVDTVARFGGDEFAILLDDPDGSLAIWHVAERIQRVLSEPFRIARQETALTVSIGVVESDARYVQKEDVLHDADAALYRAKAQGRSCFVVFDNEMHAQGVAQRQLERDLQHALQRGEFSIVYQPVLSLETLAPVGFEALIRWHHPERGSIPPDDFIPQLEETGLVLQVDEWVMQCACQQLADWQMLMPTLPTLGMSVNISSRHFHNMDLAPWVGQIVAASGIAPHLLRLEITERVMLDYTDLSIRLLAELRDLGVQVHIDDFGMGYSSLIYLHRFPFDTLKLDRAFLSGESAASTEIVRAVVILAHALHLGVIAEGIENAEQITRLQEMGCEYGQGYFLAHPMNAADATAYLQTFIAPPDIASGSDMQALTGG